MNDAELKVKLRKSLLGGEEHEVYGLVEKRLCSIEADGEEAAAANHIAEQEAKRAIAITQDLTDLLNLLDDFKRGIRDSDDVERMMVGLRGVYP